MVFMFLQTFIAIIYLFHFIIWNFNLFSVSPILKYNFLKFLLVLQEGLWWNCDIFVYFTTFYTSVLVWVKVLIACLSDNNFA
jgi:hypothetical protein